MYFNRQVHSKEIHSMPTFIFQSKHPLELRKSEAERTLRKYPDRVPIIVEPVDDAPKLDKCKFLVPRDLTVGQFKYVIRKRVKMTPEQGLFFFTETNVLLSDTMLMEQLYAKHKNGDSFLYIRFALENVFG